MSRILKKAFGSRKKDKEDTGSNTGGEAVAPVPKPPQAQASPGYGLLTVAPGINPMIDIVAVHGLNGHREKTWTSNDENGVFWLKDLLPKKIPQARIFSWGYDANTHSKDYLSESFLHQHGERLVSELSTERLIDGTYKRPIIFIGHSLGGIVIKSALIHSYGANKDHLAEHRAIKLSTHGVFFMGTPHSGGQGVKLANVAVDIASIFIQTNDKVLKHLKEQSEWLQQQKNQYAPICEHFVTKFGVETYATPLFGGSSIVVVPSWSAIGWQHNAEVVEIMKNHINIVKFTGEEDEEYAKVWKKLVLMARDAEAKVATNWAVEEGTVAVVQVAVNRNMSPQDRLELVSRLAFPPVDLGDNKPEDRIHRTATMPDVSYDQETNHYKAKSELTLIGETTNIEESEKIREHKRALIKVAALYERKVGDIDSKYSTGIKLESQHNWENVLDEAALVRKRYDPEKGSNPNSRPKLKKGLRIFEVAKDRVEQWLSLLPSGNSCSSLLCGGLRMVLVIIWRSQTLTVNTYDAIKQIPLTIHYAHDFTSQYNREILTEHVTLLYCAILDLLRHIIRRYSRIVVEERGVQFEEATDDAGLLKRYERLVDLEQEVVLERSVRIGALNALKGMEDKEWEIIFALLNDQLTKEQDNQGLQDENALADEAKIDLGAFAELYSLLEYDHATPYYEFKDILSWSDKSRVSWLLEDKEVKTWITSPSADMLLINGNELTHERTSPLSIFCGSLTKALQSAPVRIVLYWYCGINVNEGVCAMLRSMIGQLLDYVRAEKAGSKDDEKVWWARFDPDDLDNLIELFKKIAKRQLLSASIFCIFDGITFYEDHERGQDFGDLVENLAVLVEETRREKSIFKVLFTSPTRSEIVEEAANIASAEVLQVLDMPNFIDHQGVDLNELEIIASISRSSSIGSVGGYSVYEDARQYMVD